MDVQAKPPRTVIVVRLPKSTHDALKRLAAARGSSLNAICVAALDAALRGPVVSDSLTAALAEQTQVGGCHDDDYRICGNVYAQAAVRVLVPRELSDS